MTSITFNFFDSLEFFDTLGEHQYQKKIAVTSKDQPEEKKAIHCFRCHHIITYPEEALSVLGKFEHQFSNPLGIKYRFGTYRNAPGCQLVGEETRQHTWFEGYFWNIALCGKCGIHLGWRFRHEVDEFFGLILSSIIAPKPD